MNSNRCLLLDTTTLIWLMMLICVGAAACQPAPEATPTIGNASIAASDAPSDTAAPPTSEVTWARLSADGVNLSIRVPSGWNLDTIGDGIVLSEHSATMESGGELEGVQIVVFIHSVSNFSYPQEDANWARVVLTQLIHMPQYVNADAAVSTPVGFSWGGYDAAYYLLNKGHGRLEMVLALAVSRDQLVACNVSAPDALSDRMRYSVPLVLNSLTINGSPLDGSPLDSLPDPLIFPVYEEEATREAP